MKIAPRERHVTMLCSLLVLSCLLLSVHAKSQSESTYQTSRDVNMHVLTYNDINFDFVAMRCLAQARTFAPQCHTMQVDLCYHDTI